jgi:uncharacterized protein (DUF885 family)
MDGVPVAAGMRRRTRLRTEAGAAILGAAEVSEGRILNLRVGLKQGYTAPKVNVRTVIAQMDAMLKAKPEDSPFVQMAKPGADEFKKDLLALETGQIRKEIRSYRDFLSDVYLPAAREAVGVNANPHGDECYPAAVRYHATVSLTPQQVHDLGLAQMERSRRRCGRSVRAASSNPIRSSAACDSIRNIVSRPGRAHRLRRGRRRSGAAGPAKRSAAFLRRPSSSSRIRYPRRQAGSRCRRRPTANPAKH